MMKHRYALALGTAAALAASTGCNDLEDFTTAEGEAYCGQIALASAYRTGFSPRVQLRLRFDARNIDTEQSPGSLTSFDSGGDDGESFRLLNLAPLRPIPPLLHDPLAELEFGDGRERNLIYAVSPADPNADSLMAVLSLSSDDTVEVRLLRPGSAGGRTAEPPPHRRPLFGLFNLERREGQCGF